MPKKVKAEPAFTISQLADEFDISTRTIRFYEEKGLIAPRRSKGNQRVFTRRDRARLRWILRGKRFGYSLDEISEMMGMNDIDMNEADQIKKTLEYGDRKLLEIQTRIAELSLLEKDIRSIKTKLIDRLEEIDK